MSLWIAPSTFSRALPLVSMTGLDNWLLPQYDPLVQLLKNRGPRRPRMWNYSIDLHGFSPKEVSVKREKQKLRVEARHESGEDVTEVKRSVELPDDVDAEKLNSRFSSDGILLLQAPYKEQKPKQRQAMKRHQETSVWDELRSLLRGQDLKSEANSQVVESKDGAKRFKAELSVREFKPDEIRVRQQGDCVLVEAEHKEKSGGQMVHKQLERLYQLPGGTKLDQVVSKLSHDGRLCIEAPMEAPQPRKQPQLKDVPMEIEQHGGDRDCNGAENGNGK